LAAVLPLRTLSGSSAGSTAGSVVAGSELLSELAEIALTS
jgi:hypothetical protein